MDRPYPPKQLIESSSQSFIPAPEVEAWLMETFIVKRGRLTNPDHAHLLSAQIGCLWTNVTNTRLMREVVATAEMPFFRGNAWQKARQEQQLFDWFRFKPDFVITFSAIWADEADDLNWCAVNEHELYHCAQREDALGCPMFSKQGLPKFGIRGHPVEEFPQVVRRYGLDAVDPSVRQMVEAAKKRPLIPGSRVATACGTCALRLA